MEMAPNPGSVNSFMEAKGYTYNNETINLYSLELTAYRESIIQDNLTLEPDEESWAK